MRRRRAAYGQCSQSPGARSGVPARTWVLNMALSTHGAFPIRRQRGHPAVVLPLVISNSAND